MVLDSDGVQAVTMGDATTSGRNKIIFKGSVTTRRSLLLSDIIDMPSTTITHRKPSTE
jgi:hypothetical protein